MSKTTDLRNAAQHAASVLRDPKRAFSQFERHYLADLLDSLRVELTEPTDPIQEARRRAEKVRRLVAVIAWSHLKNGSRASRQAIESMNAEQWAVATQLVNERYEGDPIGLPSDITKALVADQFQPAPEYSEA